MDQSLVTGIDIGPRSLKAVILKPNHAGYALLGYKEIVFNRGIVAENDTIDHQEIVNTLTVLKKELPFFRRKVAVSLPDSAVISKALQLERRHDEQDKEFALLQAFSHQSPFPVEDLCLDYVELGEGLGNECYQVVAARKELVENRVSVLELAGLKPVLVDVNSQALGQICQLAACHYPDQAHFCLLDIGVLTSSVTVFSPEAALFHKVFVCGTGASVPQDMRDPLAAPSPSQTEALTRQIVEHLKRQLQLYTSVQGHQDISGVWLSGEGANTPLLAETLAHELGMPCERFNPLGLFDWQLSKRKRREYDEQHFAMAAGLAIRGLQWLGGEHAVSR
ncbi:type IV pilus assembly protein PilM [Vibrio sp. CAU 1672]|uniref:type IV pilus biogenesis protein PilM n=1 Tax=Vibrio sp. CAU 1672 TaxID=3032594 RepID=UPI0023DA68C4|nr:type IV pilus assembly protein PilM [Vibrio sp. CAU 1672]MDF2155680.1 type IV pilus assembly protein PilM [Vibrio sp. CAU 1672]